MRKRVAGPWDSLLPRYAPSPTEKTSVANPLLNNNATKLQFLLQHIASHGPITTEGLMLYSGMSSKQVWGLLKNPRIQGQVCFASRQWAVQDDRFSQKALDAAQLLRELGWVVQPPVGKNL